MRHWSECLSSALGIEAVKGGFVGRFLKKKILFFSILLTSFFILTMSESAQEDSFLNKEHPLPFLS